MHNEGFYNFAVDVVDPRGEGDFASDGIEGDLAYTYPLFVDLFYF